MRARRVSPTRFSFMSSPLGVYGSHSTRQNASATRKSLCSCCISFGFYRRALSPRLTAALPFHQRALQAKYS